MAYELKSKHRRFDSYNSSLSIFTFGPKSESESSESSDIETSKGEFQAYGSSVPTIARPSLESINLWSNNSFARSHSCRKETKLIEPLGSKTCCCFKESFTSDVCKCLIF